MTVNDATRSRYRTGCKGEQALSGDSTEYRKARTALLAEEIECVAAYSTRR
jgi:hypothetical protein